VKQSRFHFGYSTLPICRPIVDQLLAQFVYGLFNGTVRDPLDIFRVFLSRSDLKTDLSNADVDIRGTLLRQPLGPARYVVTALLLARFCAL
jgi:hypothetical protein